MKKNLFIYISSLLFAVILWLYINLSLNYTTSISVPVDVILSKNHGISNDLPEKIDLTIKGKGWDLFLLNYIKKPYYLLDLNEIKKETRINLLQNISKILDLSQNISVINVNPEFIDIYFDNISTKQIKIKNNLVVLPKEGYSIIGEPEIIPDFVNVTGATSVLNKIKTIPTESIKYENVFSDLVVDAKLKDTLSNVIKVEPNVVKIKYNIDLLAEKLFSDIEIKINNVPENQEVLIIPPKLNITVRGGIKSLNALNLNDFKAEIDFKELEKDLLGYVVPKIVVPKNTIIVKTEPERFQYILKKKTL